MSRKKNQFVELIKVEVNERNEQVIGSAKDLYLGLGLNEGNWARWSKTNIEENEFFKENIDWIGIRHSEENPKGGRPTTDYVITLEFAKHLIMMARTEKSHEYRDYLIKCEQALRDIIFKVGDKKHQLDCMEMLGNLLPEHLRKDKVNYMKANSIVNKTTSNYFGFPKALKKSEMNCEMLEIREKVLDDYIKLFEVLQDNNQVKDILYKKYSVDED